MRRRGREMEVLVGELPFIPEAKNPHVPGGLGFSLLELEIQYASTVMPPESTMMLMRDSQYIVSAGLDLRTRDKLLSVRARPLALTPNAVGPSTPSPKPQTLTPELLSGHALSLERI